MIETQTELSMSAKYKLGLVTSNEYTKYLAERAGFESPQDFLEFKSKRRGFKNIKDEQNMNAKKNGYEDSKSYYLACKHKNGTSTPFNESKDCSMYLGVHIAERVVGRIFGEGIIKMPIGNIGYDFLCPKGYKIDVKSSCLYLKHSPPTWQFNINRNTIADFFILLAFDNRSDIVPQHVWVINGNTEIPYLSPEKYKTKSRKLNELCGLTIPSTQAQLYLFQPYEDFEKLQKAIACCERFSK